MPNGAIGIGAGILETAGNVALGEQQYQQEQELMGIQHQNQQQLNQQGADLQYDMWKKTSYPAQVRMMEKAGLNPALMYKGAGPSGQTGSQTGGAASKGNAPQRPQINPQTIMMGLEMKRMKAEIENINAGTNKTNEETTNIAGGEREKLDAQVGQIQAQEKLTVAQEGKTNAEAWLSRTKAELEEMDVEQYKINGLSPQDATVIKMMTRAGMTIGNAWEWLWNTTTSEKMEWLYPLKGGIWDAWIKEWENKGIDFGNNNKKQ
jgi:hypothetical protein